VSSVASVNMNFSTQIESGMTGIYHFKSTQSTAGSVFFIKLEKKNARQLTAPVIG